MPGKQLDAAKFYANMLSNLEAKIGASRLGEILVRNRGAGRAPSKQEIKLNDAVLRMLVRVGVLTANTPDAKKTKLGLQFIRDVAKATGKLPERVNLVLQTYACGHTDDDGDVAPICGRMPICRQCGITRFCDYFNSPSTGKKAARIPLTTRLRNESAECMSDTEILALVLGGSSTGKKHEKSAAILIERFGNLRGVAGANYVELAALRDLEPAAALRMAATNAFHKRVQSQRRIHGTQVKCGQDFYDIYYPVLRDLRQEVFITVLLDQKHHVMRDMQVSVGTLTASLVHPREVFAGAIRESAAAVAFVHNHPSGDPTPSPEDKAITRRLCDTAKVIGIRVLDHVIVGEGTYHSFIEAGLL